jgi:hypothetical protein
MKASRLDGRLISLCGTFIDVSGPSADGKAPRRSREMGLAVSFRDPAR